MFSCYISLLMMMVMKVVVVIMIVVVVVVMMEMVVVVVMVVFVVMMVMMVAVVVTANGLVCVGIVISSALGSIVARDAWSLWGPVSTHRSSLALICTSAIFSVSCDSTKAEKPYLI